MKVNKIFILVSLLLLSLFSLFLFIGIGFFNNESYDFLEDNVSSKTELIDVYLERIVSDVSNLSGRKDLKDILGGKWMLGD